jgi:hypothetical protein
VSFRKTVVTPSVEKLCLGFRLIDIGRHGQTITGLYEDRHYQVGIICRARSG